VVEVQGDLGEISVDPWEIEGDLSEIQEAQERYREIW
jgi:hypothetical protein